MTATVLPFPTLLERDQIEFDRKGSSNYTRACDEACALWGAVKAVERHPGLTVRIAALDALIAHLARYRPDAVEDFIILDESHRITLLLVPNILRAMAGRTDGASRHTA